LNLLLQVKELGLMERSILDRGVGWKAEGKRCGRSFAIARKRLAGS
jgi:hypothetical protein